jgi:acetoin utilization protein AcuB
VDLESSLPAARELMKRHGVRHLPVVDGEKLVGLLSERELGRLEGFPMVDLNLVAVPDAMAGSPYVVTPDTPLREVVRTMMRERFGSAIVAENTRVVGMFTTTDALNVLARVLDDDQAPP